MGYSHDLLRLLVPEISPTAPELRIYGPENSARLQYVCKFIFGQVLQVKYTIGSAAGKNPWHINYTGETIDGAIKIPVAGLMGEAGINEGKPPVTRVGHEAYFYYDNDKNYDLAFDVFSAVFYFISRYEEWQ